MRSHARAVVIGGGVGGCAVLYWLARLGWTDTVLVERSKLTSGSTFHSAGLVGQLRGSLSLTRMMMNSVELYRALGEEVGLETGWHEIGSLRLASSPERMEELARQAGWAKTFGLPLELIGPSAVAVCVVGTPGDGGPFMPYMMATGRPSSVGKGDPVPPITRPIGSSSVPVALGPPPVAALSEATSAAREAVPVGYAAEPEWAALGGGAIATGGGAGGGATAAGG